MIYVTGDTHGRLDYNKLSSLQFPEQKKLTRADYVIIAGDFGGIWDGKKDNWILDWYENKPFTVCWVDGNHENFDLINQYPITEWNGGKVHQIRPSVYHLMRGQVFTIDNKTFFTFGGALSIDKSRRKEGETWWPEEIPSEQEVEEAFNNLAAHNNQVDYVITHTAPRKIMNYLHNVSLFNNYWGKIEDPTTKMLDEFETIISFKHWYFGHFHVDEKINKYTALYDRVIKI
ncbi:MAG: serine/threonine protein phosphatase [Firmicutes bacterium]|nr:serine/threonine protein phosphatase [Bacillota bacterium]